MTFKKLLAQFIIFWALLTVIIMLAIDFKMPSVMSMSDYLMTFHTAGWIAAHGKWNLLYPAVNATTFHGAPFDQLSHQLLPEMPVWSVSEYMYMPLSALVFAPYSSLKIEFSLFAWQITSLLAILASTYFVLAGSAKNFLQGSEGTVSEHTEKPKQIGRLHLGLVATATLAFLPTALTLWIGQVGLVFGLLPLTAGYYLLRRQPMLAGICFSLLFLKPQMLFLAIFLIVSELVQRRAMALAGMILGVMVLAQSNAIAFGPEVFQAWLNCLKLSDQVFSDPANGVATHLATSLPRAVLLSQPVSSHAFLKPIVYGISLLLFALGLGVVAMLSHSSSAIKNVATKLNLSLILGCLALPLIVPHLFIYDLCATVPAFYLLFAAADNSLKDLGALLIQLRRTFSTYWLILTAYCMLLVSNTTFAKPLLLVSAMTVFYIWALVAIVKYLLEKKKVEVTPQA